MEVEKACCSLRQQSRHHVQEAIRRDITTAKAKQEELTSRHVVECLEIKEEYKMYYSEMENHFWDGKVVMDVTRRTAKKEG